MPDTRNLFHPENLKIDRQLQKKANPVSSTAETTLFQLAAGGNRDAAAIAEKLGLTFEGTQTFGSDRMIPEDSAAFRIVLEVRYRTMERLAVESGCGTAADLPCGYTPLAVELTRQGMKYLGMDLPAVISEAEGIILPMIREDRRNSACFAAVDATNDESMKKVFAEAEGSLCVLTSGLLMYFSDPELEAMARSVKQALDIHGGCWITADPETEVLHFSILKAISGDRFDQVMKERTGVIRKMSDTSLGQSALTIHYRSAGQDTERAMAFLKSKGLRAERLSMAEHMPEGDPASFSLLDAAQAEKVRKVLRETAYWKITSDGSAGPDIQHGTKKGGKKSAEGIPDFRIRAERKGDLLEVKLAGRLDTLSSPELLAFYEKETAEAEVRKAAFDCEQLDFISSAGLRVLLMIQKGCRDGITMTGMNETVREIITKTGFTALFSENTCSVSDPGSPG